MEAPAHALVCKAKSKNCARKEHGPSLQNPGLIGIQTGAHDQFD
jgi:hypothetical protein